MGRSDSPRPLKTKVRSAQQKSTSGDAERRQCRHGHKTPATNRILLVLSDGIATPRASRPLIGIEVRAVAHELHGTIGHQVMCSARVSAA